jgi:hypothetical protein
MLTPFSHSTRSTTSRVKRPDNWVKYLAGCSIIDSKSDSRVSQTPVVDQAICVSTEGWEWLYANISDPSKGVRVSQFPTLLGNVRAGP